jgi:hypothetical protein
VRGGREVENVTTYMAGDSNNSNSRLTEADVQASYELARSEPRTDRKRQVRASAIRTLGEIGSGPQGPIPPCREGWVPASGNAALDELDRGSLANDPEHRQRLCRGRWASGAAFLG